MFEPEHPDRPQCRNAVVLAGLGICLLGSCVLAQQSPTTLPSTTLPSTRPLIEQLNRETQSLFQQVAGSTVRVQMPVGDVANLRSDDPLAKWADRIDADVRKRLEDIQRRAPQSGFVSAEISPATMPSSQDGAAEVPKQHFFVLQLRRFTANGIGVVMDDRSDVLVPRFVDKAAFTQPVPVMLGDGRMTSATFVGSDREADLTVLRLQSSATARPAEMFSQRLQMGTLLLVLSLDPAMNRLAVWEGWEPDFAALFTTDGRIAGFTKSGRFLSASNCQMAVQELVEHGRVRRAFLGVLIEPVPSEDAQRQAEGLSSTTPAIRIREVIPNSAAQAAGLLKGDMILEMAGQPVGDVVSFAAAIANRRGQTDILVLRQGHPRTISVELKVQ